VSQQLSEKTGQEHKEHLVRDVMKQDLGMKYAKIKTVSLHSNSVINLVLRQRFAIHLIQAMALTRRVINIDETWLGMGDFRRMKWQAPGTNNSVPAYQMAPRVSMFTALDTLGNVYVSLAQSNSNESMMSLNLQ
jgi:hypothetical protein